MGKLVYGADVFDFDDRTLTHLQMVVAAKLRRGERFFLSWSDSAGSVRERHSIWIDTGMPIRFSYEGEEQPSISRDWLEVLMAASNSSAGLVLRPETAE